MADRPLLDEVVIDGGLDPFSQNYFDIFNSLVSQNFDQMLSAGAVAIPLVPELLPEFVVEGAIAVAKEAAKTVPVSLFIQSMIQPMPTGTQADETAQLEQYWAWRNFDQQLKLGTPAYPQSTIPETRTETPEVVQLPTVTVSPASPQLPNRTTLPPELIVPFLLDFAPTHPDVELPDIVVPGEAAPPVKTAAPSRPGAVPIGLPGSAIIVLPTATPWWEAAPAIATPSMLPTPSTPTFVPFLPDFTDAPTRTRPADPSIVDLPTRLDPATDSPLRNPGITRPISDFPDLAEPTFTDPAVTTPDQVRPIELTPAIDVGIPALDALVQPLPFAGPFADPWSETPSRAPPRVGTPTDTKTKDCECASKKKKKKKTQPRSVCYRGTYRQNAKGITYKKLEEIPCEAKVAAPRVPKPSQNIRDYLPF